MKRNSLHGNKLSGQDESQELEYFSSLNDIKEHFKGKKVVLYLPFLDNSQYFEYVLNLQAILMECGANLTVVDSPYTFSIKENGSSEATRLREQFNSQLKCDVKRYPLESKFPSMRQTSKILKRNVELFRSLRSVMASQYLKRESISRTNLIFLRESRRYVQSYLQTQLSLGKLINDMDFTELILLNGRWPDQVACKQFAIENGISPFYLEAGEPTNKKWFLQPFQTLDHASMSRYLHLESEETKISKAEIEIWTKKWIEKNSNDRNFNRFLPELLSKTRMTFPNAKNAIYFTSSLEEFNSNLGINLCGWESQEQSILEIGKKLLTEGYEFQVRIHPNLANKSYIDCIKTMRFLESHRIKYYAPWEAISSYELIRKADIVVTWGSTIGIEAAAMGKPIVYAGTSVWELILNPALMPKKSIINARFSEVKPIDPAAVQRAIYFSRNWGFNMSDNNQRGLNSTTELVNDCFLRSRFVFYVARNLSRASANEIFAAAEIIFGKRFGSVFIKSLFVFISKLVANNAR